MSDVFISYKREERPKALAIAQAVATRGYDAWWDVELLPGDKFADEIEAVIRKAKVAIVLWSKESVKSTFVRAEASLALKREILIPVRLDDTNIPLPFGEHHILDLQNWNGSSEDPLLNPLLDAIEKRIGKGRTSPGSAIQIETILGQPEAEADYWKSISERTPQDIEEYKAYLLRYGENGAFSDLASLRIEKRKFEKKTNWPKIAKVLAGTAAIVGILAGGAQIADRFGLLDKTRISADGQGEGQEIAQQFRPISLKDFDAKIKEINGNEEKRMYLNLLKFELSFDDEYLRAGPFGFEEMPGWLYHFQYLHERSGRGKMPIEDRSSSDRLLAFFKQLSELPGWASTVGLLNIQNMMPVARELVAREMLIIHNLERKNTLGWRMNLRLARLLAPHTDELTIRTFGTLLQYEEFEFGDSYVDGLLLSSRMAISGSGGSFEQWFRIVSGREYSAFKSEYSAFKKERAQSRDR